MSVSNRSSPVGYRTHRKPPGVDRFCKAPFMLAMCNCLAVENLTNATERRRNTVQVLSVLSFLVARRLPSSWEKFSDEFRPTTHPSFRKIWCHHLYRLSSRQRKSRGLVAGAAAALQTCCEKNRRPRHQFLLRRRRAGHEQNRHRCFVCVRRCFRLATSHARRFARPSNRCRVLSTCRSRP